MGLQSIIDKRPLAPYNLQKKGLPTTRVVFALHSLRAEPLSNTGDGESGLILYPAKAEKRFCIASHVTFLSTPQAKTMPMTFSTESRLFEKIGTFK